MMKVSPQKYYSKMGRKPKACTIRRIVNPSETTLVNSKYLNSLVNSSSSCSNDKTSKAEWPQQSSEEAADKLQKKSTSFTYQSMAREDHGQAIYAISFCKSKGYERIFATVGTNRIMLYECLPSGALDVIKVYLHEDKEEDFFTVGWTVDVFTGGRPLLAAAGSRGHIYILHPTLQGVTMILSGHGNAVNEIKFHPMDPSLLFSVSRDESLRLWNITTGVCVAMFSGHLGHRDEILSLDVHLLGKYVVSCGMDNTLKVWDLTSDDVLVSRIKESYTTPRRNGRPFPTYFVQNPFFSTSRVHSDYVDCVAFVGDLIVSKSTANKILLWKPNLVRGKDAVTTLGEYTFADANLWFMKFSMDEELERIAVGDKSGRVYVWDIDNDLGKARIKLVHSQSKSTVRHTGFSADGMILVYVCDDGTVWRYDDK